MFLSQCLKKTWGSCQCKVNLADNKSVSVFCSLYSNTHLFVAVDLLQRTRVTPSRTKGLTSDLSQVAGSAARVQDMLATMLAYIEDVLVSIRTVGTMVRLRSDVISPLFPYSQNDKAIPPAFCVPCHSPAFPSFNQPTVSRDHLWSNQVLHFWWL